MKQPLTPARLLAVSTGLCAVLLSAGCQIDITLKRDPVSGQPDKVPPLPVAITNNAVALINQAENGYRLFSLAGLVSGTSWRNVSNRVFSWSPGDADWRELPPVPGREGRLAATAQAVAGQVYFFGGYSVAADGTEVSTPDVFVLDPDTHSYQKMPDMPVPVDDSVSAVWRNRFIYLVSGWHNDDNVSNVQVFDTQTHSWAQATPFPGNPVFGHAGGLARRSLIICDGVTVKQPQSPGGRRSFSPTADCYSGRIDLADPTKISWRQISAHPGPPLYRSAAIGLTNNVVFFGGSDNPYNYNGIGYDSRPSAPSGRFHQWDVANRTWQVLTSEASPSMDHRGALLTPDGKIHVVGGMGRDQQLLQSTSTLEIPYE